MLVVVITDRCQAAVPSVDATGGGSWRSMRGRRSTSELGASAVRSAVRSKHPFPPSPLDLLGSVARRCDTGGVELPVGIEWSHTYEPSQDP